MASYASEYYGGGAVDPGTVAAAMAEPKSATADGVTVTQHSLPDRIAAEKYERAKVQARDKYRGIRFAKAVPPGA